MIDLSQFDGYTPGPWYVGVNKIQSKDELIATADGLGCQYAEITVWHDADKNLIEQAPLLLEEVIRLRAVLSELAECDFENVTSPKIALAVNTLKAREAICDHEL